MANAFQAILTFTLIFWISTLSAQNFGTRTSFVENWKIELRGGSGALLSPVPDQYLSRINHVNIPLHAPGPLGTFAVKKGFMGHFEMGYQMDLMHVRGTVEEKSELFSVRTTALAHNILVLVNLKKTNEYRPRTNFSLYYKAGAIYLKNVPRRILPDGSFQEMPNEMANSTFIDNLAIGTGLGLGMNRQWSENFSFTGSVEYNRVSDLPGDVYRISKLFYDSPNKINTFLTLTGGVCYTFNFSGKENPVFFVPRTETERRLIQHRKIQRSRR